MHNLKDLVEAFNIHFCVSRTLSVAKNIMLEIQVAPGGDSSRQQFDIYVLSI